MGRIQISQELFIDLIRYFVLEDYNYFENIKKALEKKTDSMLKREYYTKYKTAPSEKEREEARQKYLDMCGIPKSFRW